MEITDNTIAMAWRQAWAKVKISNGKFPELPYRNLRVDATDYPVDYVTLFTAIYDYLAKDETLATYPSDWWQAFKARWFPSWLKKRFPVRLTKIIAEHMFPEITMPDLGREGIHIKEVKE